MVTIERNDQVSVSSHEIGDLDSGTRYRRLMFIMALSISLVALSPLLIMTGINYHQYQEVFHAELIRPIMQNTGPVGGRLPISIVKVWPSAGRPPPVATARVGAPTLPAQPVPKVL